MDITVSILKERAVIIFADSDTSIGLRVSQMPISSKVAFFCANDRQTDRQTDNDDRQNRLHDPLCMHAG